MVRNRFTICVFLIGLVCVCYWGYQLYDKYFKLETLQENKRESLVGKSMGTKGKREDEHISKKVLTVRPRLHQSKSERDRIQFFLESKKSQPNPSDINEEPDDMRGDDNATRNEAQAMEQSPPFPLSRKVDGSASKGMHTRLTEEEMLAEGWTKGEDGRLRYRVFPGDPMPRGLEDLQLPKRVRPDRRIIEGFSLDEIPPGESYRSFLLSFLTQTILDMGFAEGEFEINIDPDPESEGHKMLLESLAELGIEY